MQQYICLLITTINFGDKVLIVDVFLIINGDDIGDPLISNHPQHPTLSTIGQQIDGAIRMDPHVADPLI